MTLVIVLPEAPNLETKLDEFHTDPIFGSNNVFLLPPPNRFCQRLRRKESRSTRPIRFLFGLWIVNAFAHSIHSGKLSGRVSVVNVGYFFHDSRVHALGSHARM